MQIPVWLVPSFYGDIRLVSTGPKSCTVVTEKLTEREKEALRSLEKKAKDKRWITAKGSLLDPKTDVQAPLDKVAQALAKVLKPGRKIVSAVKFVSGRMEEITEATFDDATPIKPKVDGPYRTQAETKADEDKPEEKEDKPKAATSVAAPVRGCPPPDFARADIKAREVLMTFLSRDQIEDFLQHNRFISVGATTGHRYMITSRHAKDQLALWHRSLYDLETKTPLCVHDWDIPAAEEMLGLHILLQLPGWEKYLRKTEDEFEPVFGDEQATTIRICTSTMVEG
jgi:hypothetical protein